MAKKLTKIALFLLPFVVLIIVIQKGKQVYTEVPKKQSTVKKKETFPAAFEFQTLSGEKYTSAQVQFHPAGAVIIYFDPSCGLCHDKVKEVKKYFHEFLGMSILVVSSAPVQEMDDFVSKHNLDNYPEITVLKSEEKHT